LKITGHYNTGSWVKEVEEESMTTARVQEQQRQATAKA
jgi:hypothetical protein